MKPYIPTKRAKALAILKIRPKTIILGSSRTELGMDPNHSFWDFQPVFNAAFGGADIYDSFYYLKHANSTGELKKAVIMVDFFMFNAQRKRYVEEDYEFLELIEKQSELFKLKTLKYLMSLQTIGDSFKTLMNKDLTNKLNIYYGLLKVPQNPSRSKQRALNNPVKSCAIQGNPKSAILHNPKTNFNIP